MKRAPGKSTAHAIQIIGGEYRSRKINVIDADGLRPTASRVRETLFNWLQLTIPGAIVIDAFAGSGALGIEALSRGAKKAIFIEKDPAVYRQLQANLNTLKIPESRYTLLPMSALEFLKQDPLHPEMEACLTAIEEEGLRSHLFLDPPFHHNLYSEIFNLLQGHPLTEHLTSLSLEMPHKLPLQAASFLPLKEAREMKTKESRLYLFRAE
ncbi:16S rRNA (guanine(966)-N(2))-methyltransferase RsmD [Ignatzschineria ureiclastica]|uniref:Ribosomal RNA small subunit methyltransferase D n=1 Tax=Ignatzschineria ureiclastica TaxID=472582 RepID=A0A2U2AHD8_9GAMM|nr:16S rRNA (guanine(966)-N(2))-methyltransferase RsmD [Ignatzschineria ureiclastica]PWD82057.1 16S rRNA (guanine(966)-N(2))-methyltransferase RsmD [Ignatzschineria ureiclastica]GGZ92336.1 ribosomal RNA small subunit methyltransferase D [Ignatzschineria ureiclastica]